MTMLDRCNPRREGTFPEFVSQDKRNRDCKHIGKNSGSYVRQYLVDGAVFPEGTTPKRCDFLLLNDTKKTAYYIEFKGSNIVEATKQIDCTVELLQASHSGYTVYRRIIYRTGRSHEVKDARVVRWQTKHGKETIVIASHQYTDQL